jgi:hypothetical protein
VVAGGFTFCPEQGHIAQVPLKRFSDVNGSVKVGVVFPTVRTDEKSLSLSFPLASAGVAGSACVGFTRRHHDYNLQVKGVDLLTTFR